jgi:rhodanese-related sulfurtransferase
MMTRSVSRRRIIFTGACAIAAPALGHAQQRDVWSADEAQVALALGRLVMLDIRTRDEWRETGVAKGAWPVSMREDGFRERLLAARSNSGDNPVALICATGGRSGFVFRALRTAGYSGYVDVSEGMFGSRAGPGWIARGLPVVPIEDALATLPSQLRT